MVMGVLVFYWLWLDVSTLGYWPISLVGSLKLDDLAHCSCRIYFSLASLDSPSQRRQLGASLNFGCLYRGDLRAVYRGWRLVAYSCHNSSLSQGDWRLAKIGVSLLSWLRRRGRRRCDVLSREVTALFDFRRDQRRIRNCLRPGKSLVVTLRLNGKMCRAFFCSHRDFGRLNTFCHLRFNSLCWNYSLRRSCRIIFFLCFWNSFLEFWSFLNAAIIAFLTYFGFWFQSSFRSGISQL